MSVLPISKQYYSSHRLKHLYSLLWVDMGRDFHSWGEMVSGEHFYFFFSCLTLVPEKQEWIDFSLFPLQLFFTSFPLALNIQCIQHAFISVTWNIHLPDTHIVHLLIPFKFLLKYYCFRPSLSILSEAAFLSLYTLTLFYFFIELTWCDIVYVCSSSVSTPL